MATDPAEQVLATVVKADHLDLKNDAEDRLKGSFVWNRAQSLLSGEGVSAAVLSARVQVEYGLLKAYIDSKLGADRVSGPLVPVRGGTGDVSPPHLDLIDVTRVFTSDLSPDSTRATKLDANAHDATDDRERRVLAIVWRAGYLVSELWTPSPDHTTATLNRAALDELLDRRLRICERMAFNVSGQQTMLGLASETHDINKERWDLSKATATSGWLDKTRVRLFEYPFVPNYFKAVAGSTVGTTWLEQIASVQGGGSPRLAYIVKQIATRTYTDSTVEPVQSTTSWRIPSPSDANWRVSPGDDAGFGVASTPPLANVAFSYRIDFLPTGAAVDAIDAMFDYTSTTADGAPVRADFWNRSWLFCDHVIALLCLEAFVFARRRRPGTNVTTEFAALTARRPQVPVRSSPNGILKNVVTPYVCLDGQVGTVKAPDQKVIMASQGPDPITGDPIDKLFENKLVPVESLQVGDHVIVINAPMYRSFTQDGEWGIENAIVMDIDSTVNDRENRGGVRRDEIQLQGHGTRQLSHRAYRKLMRDVVAPAFAAMLQRLKAGIQANSGATTAVIDGTRQVVFKWLPFSDGPTKIEFAPGEPLIPSGPWWMQLTFTKDFAFADDAIKVLKKTVGGSMVVGTTDLPTIPGLPLSFDDSILVPLFEPAIRSKGGKRVPWAAYFDMASKPPHSHGANLILRPTVIDEDMIPGLFLRGMKEPIGVVRPRVRES